MHTYKYIFSLFVLLLNHDCSEAIITTIIAPMKYFFNKADDISIDTYLHDKTLSIFD